MAFFDFLKRKELTRIAELEKQLSKYSSIRDLEAEITRRRQQLDIELDSQRKSFMNQLHELSKEEYRKKDELAKMGERLDELQSKYQSSLEIYKNLRKEIGLYESKLDVIEFGIYEPVYDFERSEDYRKEQERIINWQKEKIKDDTAATCNRPWTVDNSEAKGRTLVNRYKKLMLRAFNGECEALIAKVKWNNVNQMKERMAKLWAAINKLGEHMSIYITQDYYLLKERELVLEYEYQAKRQQEKEQMRAIQEELREEEKARREFEQAQRNAEKEAANYEKALEKARREVEEATGARQIKLQAQIELLQQQLQQAQEQKERAISMAQQTKRGHVYIISNIGSFGENIYKIGMTRRLEPTDRIRELGDASVPFQFDIHALIYCDDAPTLENSLHRAFSDKKVNMLNYRKEFFNVSIDEIENKIKEIGLNAELTVLPEAMEYRETMAIREKLLNQKPVVSIDDQIAAKFPPELVFS